MYTSADYHVLSKSSLRAEIMTKFIIFCCLIKFFVLMYVKAFKCVEIGLISRFFFLKIDTKCLEKCFNYKYGTGC